MQGPGLILTSLGDFSQMSDRGKIYKKFRIFFVKFVDHMSISVKLMFVEDAWIVGLLS
jgi:hypothetical protein